MTAGYTFRIADHYRHASAWAVGSSEGPRYGETWLVKGPQSLQTLQLRHVRKI